MTSRRALLITYDGSEFIGWQVQKTGRSVQGVLESVIKECFRETVRIVGAGRTDSGVHARGQVAHVDLRHALEPERLALALNSRLPADVRVLKAARVASTFHARRDARHRRYSYTLSDAFIAPVLDRRLVAHVAGRLDVDCMAEAAGLWLGKHDFSSFRAAVCAAESPVRTLDRLDVRRDEAGRIRFDIEARAFLQHQVRTMVGTLMEIGKGARPIAWAREVLDARDRAAAGPNVPSCGLIFEEVRYVTDPFAGEHGPERP